MGAPADPDAAVAGPGGEAIRRLRADEAGRLAEAIRAVYGDSYDAPWVFDAHEVARRISQGLMVSVIAESADGDLLCHAAMTFRSHQDRVGHVGQAVTMPAARGHHLFTAVKRHLADIATERGLAGMYSEATAAHPYSQRANVELGAHETGFLLGWIPATVANDAAAAGPGRRQSVALFYMRTNARPGAPGLRPAPPPRGDPPDHRHLRPARPPGRPAGSRPAAGPLDGPHPPADRPQPGRAHRDRARPRPGGPRRWPSGTACSSGASTPSTSTCPLDLHATALVADELESLGVTYAGIFPNTRAHGDVVRLQSLNGVQIAAADVSVASEHGRELLDYVLADLAAAGHEVGTA